MAPCERRACRKWHPPIACDIMKKRYTLSDSPAFQGIFSRYMMTFIQHLDSPLGDILLAADDVGLTGLWFEGQKYFAATLPAEVQTKETPALREGKRWLDLYFAGKEPKTSPPLHLIGTPFRLSVWKILSEIPYGKTTTYGDIAQRLAQERGLPRLSARAVGRNPISLIIPCHRVIGRNDRLTGYAGGLHRKAYLLALERRQGDRETLDFRLQISDL